MIATATSRNHNRLVVGLIFVVLSITPFTTAREWVLPALLLAVLLAAVAGSAPTLHLAILACLGVLAPKLFSTFPPLLVAKAVPLLLYVVVVATVPTLRRSLSEWLRLGSMDRKSWITVLLVIVLSAGALCAWARYTNPNLAGYARLVPDLPAVVLPPYVLAFAAINALAEELLWRGAMLASLETAFGAGALAMALQALQFGIAHYRGPFLFGWGGVALSGLFGWWLGRLRRRTGGLLACWLVHTAADFAILLLVVFFARKASA